MKMLCAVQRRLQQKSDEGSVAAEYGLLIAGIAVLIGVGAAALGGRIDALFDSITF